jgi:hypothetical protein
MAMMFFLLDRRVAARREILNAVRTIKRARQRLDGAHDASSRGRLAFDGPQRTSPTGHQNLQMLRISESPWRALRSGRHNHADQA